MATGEGMISQNAPARKPKKRSKEVPKTDLEIVQTDGEVVDNNPQELKKTQKKKRKRSKMKKYMEAQKLELEREDNEKQRLEREDNEKRRLESLLFGSIYNPTEFGNELEEDPGENPEENEKPMWFADKSPGGGEMVVYEEDLRLQRKSISEEEMKPAWVDEEEEETEVDIRKVNRLRKLRREEDEALISGIDYVNRLRSEHAKLNPGTQWAQLGRKLVESDSESDAGSESDTNTKNGLKISGDSEFDILRSNEDLVVKSRGKLRPGQIEYSRLRDANAEDPSNSIIRSVEFHRNAQLLLTAGFDKRLKFFQIDGKRNPEVQSVFIDNFPIHKASFLPDGSQVIIAGRRKSFYSFDLVKGRLDRTSCLLGREEKSLENFEVSSDSSIIAFLGNEGYILLVSTKTKQLIGTLKMNGSVRSLAFADNGRQLLSSGGDGQVYHWDLGTRKCIHKGNDEGCINGTSLSVSPDGNLFATGSDSGIVNVYNRDAFLGGVKRPLKSVTNLVTMVDNLKFNCDSQILAICSRFKRDSLRLVHLPSCSVFSNWPSPKIPLQYVQSLDFSPGGGFMAIGNAAGKVLLFKLHHYQHA